MNGKDIRRLRIDYLREHHANEYRELKDDGVLEAHLRHVQGHALAYYAALIAEGTCGKTAEKQVYHEVIAVQRRTSSILQRGV